MAKGPALKDALFNADSVALLAGELRRVDSTFAPDFEARALRAFPALELKARITHLGALLAETLPRDFAEAAALIEAALPPPLDPTLSDADFGRFIHAAYGEFAVLRGLDDHPARALDLLAQVTQRFSMEYAIRPFLNRWPDLTLGQMRLWADHPHYHLRRLVSEGTRPRLPWGAGISCAPTMALPLLDRLHADPTRFVTRSVANHLNDITRTDPDAVIARLRHWAAEGRQSPAELHWMTRHALRGLVKRGHPEALALLGFGDATGLTARLTLADTQIAPGAALQIEVRLDGPPGPVLVDYILHLARAGGGQGARVFKLKQAEIPPHGPLILRKSHRLLADATTYRLHPGPQAISLQVNGQILARAAFTITA